MIKRCDGWNHISYRGRFPLHFVSLIYLQFEWNMWVIYKLQKHFLSCFVFKYICICLLFRVTTVDTCMSMTCFVIPKTWFMKVRFHSCHLTFTKHMNRLTGLKKEFPHHQLYISGKSCAYITTLWKGEHQVRCLTYELGHDVVLDTYSVGICWYKHGDYCHLRQTCHS
jgi:hypothetical protein